jgi:hypothetical protein
MLTFEQAEEIVTRDFDILDPQVYRVERQDRGRFNILYTIFIHDEYLGRYQVMKDTEGKVGYGSTGFNDKYDKEWDFIIWKMLFFDLKRAEKQLPTQADKRGPTIQTEIRFEIFKKIKDAHLNYTYDVVAMKANEQEHVENYTGGTVRNTYKAMHEKWVRADRIR